MVLGLDGIAQRRKDRTRARQHHRPARHSTDDLGHAVRIKLENTRAETPTTYSAAYMGTSDEGAAVVARTNTRLTFRGEPGLTLAPGEHHRRVPDLLAHV